MENQAKKTTERPEVFTVITTVSGVVILIDKEGNVVIKSQEGVTAFDSSNPTGPTPPPPGH